GRHVQERPSDCARDAQTVLTVPQACDPKINENRYAFVAASKDDVLGLEVAVDDASGVHLSKGGPYPAHERGGANQIERPVAQLCSQRGAAQKRHRQTGSPVFIDPGINNGYDTGMPKGPQRRDLPGESITQVLGGGA